jgi:uncharacterized delta-60 repeat protein
MLAGITADASTPGVDSAGVARLHPDGSLDTSFAGVGWRRLDALAGDDLVNGQVLLSDGRLRLCGQGWPVVGGQSDFVVYGLMADGSMDASFNGTGVRLVDFGSDDFGGCEPGGNDSVLVFGVSYFGASGFDFSIARVLVDGTLDPAFGDGSTGQPGMSTVDFGTADDSCEAAARQADGKILLAGHAGNDSALARLLPTGTLDPSFNGTGKVSVDLGGVDSFGSVIVLPDGRIACGGSVTGARGDTVFSLAVFTPDGVLDSSVGTGGLLTFDVTPGQSDAVLRLRLDSLGRLLVFGSTSDGTSNNFALLRLWL